MNIKKLALAFIASAVLLSGLMIVCIDRSEEALPSVTPDTPEGSADLPLDSGELRGVWVPYFSLGSRGQSREEFEKRFAYIVSTAKNHGLNALFIHVRSHCDAAYPSGLFPAANEFEAVGMPRYDPLSYMTETAHKSGLSVHAWINPYRVCDAGDELQLNSPCRRWIGTNNLISDGGALYLNPASGDARALIIDGVREIVRGYDVDGVHFDDYFYPGSEEPFDEAEYSAYLESVSGSDALSLKMWRCENVNKLIRDVYSAVKAEKNDVLFGISPQGNIENDLDAGADCTRWCSEPGFIDYIAPQLYYNDENPVCPFTETARRWRRICGSSSVNLYIGLALYKAGSDEDSGTWRGGGILADQYKTACDLPSDGVILYSFDYLEGAQTEEEISALDEAVRAKE